MIKERQLTDYELSRPVLALAKRFVQRWDLHARQLPDGRYICIHQPLTVEHLFAHLRGEITLGTYILSRESQARFTVLDADDDQGFKRLACLARELAVENVPSYLEGSRRGGHLWFFLAKAIPGHDAQAFTHGVLTAHKVEDIEVFPKQGELRGGPGTLIRIPFGIHKLSGQRYGFYHPNGMVMAPTLRDQIYMLSTPQTVPEMAFNAYLSYAPSLPLATSYNRSHESTDLLSERIKENVSVLEFVSQYVDLKPTGSGAIGLCPFHYDHWPSLGVNDQGNYWHCFAGCGGGSIIDFWMKWRNLEFMSALAELAYMLL